MELGCVECIAELDHCHGMLVAHEGYLVECTEPGCVDLDHARHAVVLGCWDVDDACVCGEVAVIEYARAS